MRARETYEVGHIVVGTVGGKIVVEAELKDSHARESQASPKVFHLGSDDSEIFGDEGKSSKFAVGGFE